MAEMTRTSTGMGLLSPTRSMIFSSSTRRSFTWVAKGQVADFVQEDIAPLGHFKPAGPALVGSGVGPLDVPEESRFRGEIRSGRRSSP